MKRTYLIDSENINDIWVELLQCMDEKDEILVFYTDKSAHMGYERIIRLMEQKKGSIRWIRCFEGQNALDFQLVTELGSRISQEPKREYTIVSNDTGYDAVVRYWQQKECRVRRMKSVECETLVGSGKAAAEEARAAQLIVEKAAQEAVAAQTAKKEQAAKEAQATKEAQEAKEAQAVKEAQAMRNTQAAKEARAAREAQTVREPQAGGGNQTAKGVQTDRQAHPAKDTQTAREMQAAKDTEAAKGIQAAGEQQSVREQQPGKGTQPERQTSGEPQIFQEVVPEPEPEVVKETRFETVETWQEELRRIFQDNGSRDTKSDMEFLQELCKTVKLSNMSLMHNVMEYHFGQETGNAIYHFIKENPGCRGELSAGYSNNKKQREKQYLALILKRNHIIPEEGDEDAILKILGGIPRKNLNSIHTALVKKFGQEEGGNCYAVLRNHVKIIRGL